MGMVRMNRTWGQLLLLAWRMGGRVERRFVIIIASSVPILLAPLFIVLGYSLASGNMSANPDLYYQVFLSMLIVAGSWSLFQAAMNQPLYGPHFYREGIRQGWFSPSEARLASETARYKEAFGMNGQLEQDVLWGYAFALTYYGAYLVSIVYSFLAYPALGDWTFLLFAMIFAPIAIGCWMSNRRRLRRRNREARRLGFSVARRQGPR